MGHTMLKIEIVINRENRGFKANYAFDLTQLWLSKRGFSLFLVLAKGNRNQKK